MVISSTNSLKGTHNITISLQDEYNAAISVNFTLTILENLGPTRLKFISNYDIVNYNLLTIAFEPIDTLFNDPDGRPMTALLIQGNGDPLPSFLTYNSVNNTLSGIPEQVNIGEWVISYVAIDDNNQTANISFTINVYPCYYKWTTWTDQEYNKCTGWKSGYFLQYNQCKTSWDGDSYANPITWTWVGCHNYWLQWADSTQFNWSSWNPGYFYLNNAWYSTWPDGYYNDYETSSCKKCNAACTKWFGSTSKSCTVWNSTALYLLSGSSEWKLATCLTGYYLNNTNLQWYNWDAGCNSCEYPNVHTCKIWNSIYKMITPGLCTFCSDIAGYVVNEFGICVERCGDGLNFGQHECDDGNTNDGDGWSSTWYIESGFACNGTFWWEIVRPTASITDVSIDNLLTITFSEPVKFEVYSLFSSNLKTTIKGPLVPYKYSVIIDQSNLSANTPFTSFMVQISNVQANLEGNYKERIEVWFDDTSVVKDLSNNSLSEGNFINYLNTYEYLSPSVVNSVSNGGQSMKYAIISLFSINLLVKIVISSSASLMWSLIHVLQIYRYILLMNINFPKLNKILLKYLAVVVGDVEEMDSMVPDVINTYILNPNDLKKNQVTLSRFVENGYNSPYLTDQYGRKFFMLIFFTIIWIPVIYLGSVYLHKVKWIGKMFVESWEGLFWNAPIRTLVELFIELSLWFFLNSLNVRFLTMSGIIATTILFIVSLIIVTFPFIILTLVSKPPLYVKTNRYNSKYGALTEDLFKRKTMYQRSYYPLFVFYRVLLTAVLVYQYDRPVLQIAIIMIMQLIMILYMMKMRPFKSELVEVIAVSDEFTLVFGLALIYVLYLNQYNIKKTQLLMFIIIGVICFSLLKNIGTIAYLAISGSYRKIRAKVHKRFKVKDIIKRKQKEERRKFKKQQEDELRLKQIDEELKQIEHDEMIKKRRTVNTRNRGASITISSLNHQPNQISELPSEVPKSKAKITQLMNSLKKIKSVKNKSDAKIKDNTDALEITEDQHLTVPPQTRQERVKNPKRYRSGTASHVLDTIHEEDEPFESFKINKKSRRTRLSFDQNLG